MMVQIVEHHAETSEDFLVEEEAASSTPRVPYHPVLGTAAVHAAQQHTTAQTSRMPSRATPGALSTARELLRHPPSSTASPGVMKTSTLLMHLYQYKYQFLVPLLALVLVNSTIR
jgi:hypothetical protein